MSPTFGPRPIRKWYNLTAGCRPLLNEIVIVLLPENRQVIAVYDPEWEFSFYTQSSSGGKESIREKIIGWRPYRGEVAAMVRMRPNDGTMFE